MTDDLQRFVEAQAGTYAAALAELRRGEKRGHWIWWVFPQLEGLGSSATSRRYALANPDDAVAWLRHPVLGPRLAESVAVVRGQVERSVPLRTLMGSAIDCAKLVSSLTLFVGVGPGEPGREALVADAQAELAVARQQGFGPCAFTERALAGAAAERPPRTARGETA
ncbi:MAG: DUF1810 family protein [Deltaproteobacteria bacterium]|nr:DUF1810 family protein [Deltaproteobacteria bacterium]